MLVCALRVAGFVQRISFRSKSLKDEQIGTLEKGREICILECFCQNMQRENAYISHIRNKLEASLERNRSLEKENQVLKKEVQQLKSQLASFQAAHGADSRSLQKLHGSVNGNMSSDEKQKVHSNMEEGSLVVKNIVSSLEVRHSKVIEERAPREPKPPPRPSSCPPSTLKLTVGSQMPAPPPPPPPPPPLKQQGGSTTKSVRRVPEVVELYQYLTRREGKPDVRTSIPGTPVAMNPREMIGEIENRSAYLLAIKSDVETQSEFINFLTREVKNAAYKNISDVEAFVKWLDGELSFLADERAVLRHFPQWPEKKADAMREAAFAYRDLKNLESEVTTFSNGTRQPTVAALKQMRALQEKVECSVHNLERVRDNATKRYGEFHIPSEWMLDNGIISQLKLGSLKLAKQYMKRVVNALQSDGVSEDEDLMLQGVRFAFRVHQFVGGFDEESRNAFQELRQLVHKFHT